MIISNSYRTPRYMTQQLKYLNQPVLQLKYGESKASTMVMGYFFEILPHVDSEINLIYKHSNIIEENSKTHLLPT